MPPQITLLLALFVAFVLYLAWKGSPTGWQVTILFNPNDDLAVSGIPRAKQWRVKEFFQQDIRLTEPVKVQATKTQEGRLHLRVHGDISPGLKQRLRNFLYDLL